MGIVRSYLSFFKNHPTRDGLLYLGIIIITLSYAVLAITAETWVSYWACNLPPSTLKFENPLYPSDPCLDERHWEIGMMTRREADRVRRTICAVLLGSVIGYERRSPDRPAGIRTMSITALGSCTFTIAGTFAFQKGPMAWDASRISASIPSGVGFLGAGLIWKGFVKDQAGGEDVHQIHGLTTAASIWMSAAIGVASGGAMYPVAAFATVTVVMLLRFGPRNREAIEEEEEREEEEGARAEEQLLNVSRSSSAAGAAGAAGGEGLRAPFLAGGGEGAQHHPGLRKEESSMSVGGTRRRPKGGTLMSHN